MPEISSSLYMIIMLLVMFAVMYFFVMRPENKKRKESEKMRSELVVGDTVSTIGGLIGTICTVKDKTVVIETGADRVRVEFVKEAISARNVSINS